MPEKFSQREDEGSKRKIILKNGVTLTINLHQFLYLRKREKAIKKKYFFKKKKKTGAALFLSPFSSFF